VEVTLVLAAGGVAAGIFGALLGLGGGILIVPLLTLGMGLPVREAVGVSLVCVIVTSGAAAGVYLQRRVANLRLGMFLELFTAGGALVGGLAAFLLPEAVLAGLFAILLFYTAVSMVRRPAEAPQLADAPIAAPTAIPATAPRATDAAVPEEREPPAPAPLAGDATATVGWRAALSGPDYRVHALGVGVAGSLTAGVVSALLGIGGGIVKVPLMHLAMGVPLRVATATSNLMIGVTASASAIIYLLRGGIDPLVVGPTALGVFVGAMVGSRTAQRLDVRVLRFLFVFVLLYTAAAMARRAIGGG
jgi:uncharacterized protein